MSILLDYPFDTAELLRKKRSLLREAREREVKLTRRVALLGGSTTSELRDFLELFLRARGIGCEYYESEFGKFYEDAVFANPKLEAFRPDLVIVHTTTQNLRGWPSPTMSAAHVDALRASELLRFEEVWSALSARFHCPIIQNNFEEPLFRPLGNLDFSDHRGRVRFVRELNDAFAKRQESTTSLFINDIHYLSAWLGLDRWYERRHWHAYKMAMSLDAIPHVAHQLSNLIGALFGVSRKVLALDLDNTLWGGVIGDDGVNGIRIGRETPEGEGHTEFQEYVHALQERGVLLAVCSKNDANIAEAGLTHPDSVIRREDVMAFEANWDPKNENLRKIARTLNVGVDSLVFVDDNPAERALARREVPQVAVPEVGSEISRFAVILDKAGYFETVALSAEDLRRSAQYAENAMREAEVQRATDYDGFLRSLQMTAEIRPFHELYLDRITQLTNKTNQFNLTTRRYTSEEIRALAHSDAHICLYGRLVDRFGDNGIVSIVVAERREDRAYIDLWLMSCRVLKRGLEHAMMDALVAASRACGVEHLHGRYLPTAKNGMVRGLYSELGFRLVSETPSGEVLWQYDLPDEYQPQNHFIEVNP